MGDYTVLIATLRMLQLQKTAHLVLRRFITLPAHDTKARTGFAEPQGFRGRILAAPLAEQERVSNLGLWARGQFTPLDIVRVGKLGHTLETLGRLFWSAVFPIEGTGWGHLRPQTSLALPPGRADLKKLVSNLAGWDLTGGSPLQGFPFISRGWPRLEHTGSSIQKLLYPSKLVF